MKIERTKNATRNIFFGTIMKLYQIFFPFIMRTAMIYFMGVQYLGLNSLFTSVLQVLNLAELGVGSAMVYSMYKPIAEDDQGKICALMRLYKIYYRVIGIIVFVAGMVLLPYIPHLVKSDLPKEINIYILYLMNLGITVLSYWLFAYKNALFQAHQRTDVVSKITLITNTLQYGLQLFIIVFVKNYYFYTLIALITQALTNVITAIAASKMYPSYHPEGKLNKEEVEDINHRIRDLFTSKIGGVIVNSADTIVISAFLGLKILAIYQNYFFILSSVIGISMIIFNACTAGIGNSVITETKEKNFYDLKKFTFIIAWITGFSTTCLLCLYQPFMFIWVGKNLMLRFEVVICFCVYFFVYEINQLLCTYKDAAGIWHEDRFRPLVTAVTNLGMNLIMVQFWGIYGVILSTVLSIIFIGTPWLLHNLFTVLFDKNQLFPYLKKLIYYVSVVLIGCILTFNLCNLVKNTNKWVDLLIKAVFCCLLPNLLYLLAFHKMDEFRESIIIGNRITKGKIPLLKKYSK